MFSQPSHQPGMQGWKPDPALFTSERHFQRLLEKLPAGAYTCDPDGLITYFNQHAEHLWDRKPRLNDPVDRFCGSFKLFATDGTPISHDQCWMALALKRVREFNGREIVIERPDGQRRTVLAYANPILDEGGTLLGAVNVLVDITQRKLAESALEEQHRHLTLVHDLSMQIAQARSLEAIYDTALDAILEATRADRAAILLLESDGGLHFKAWRDLSDTYRAVIQGHAPRFLKHADDAPITILDVEANDTLGPLKAATLEEGIRTMALIPLAEKHQLMGKVVLCASVPGALDEPEVQLAQTIANHVAFAIERKRAEEALVTSERRLRAILDASTALIFVKDLEGRYTTVNRAWTDLFHLTEAEVLGSTDAELFPAPIAEAFQANDLLVHEAAGPLCFEEHTITGDAKPLIYLSVKFPLRDAEGRIYGIGGISTDITELKSIQNALLQSEEQYRSLNETLEQRVAARTRELARANELLAQRNSELQDFAQVASHDLQEPLRKFRTFLDLLRQELDAPNNGVLDYIARMEVSADRMSQLTTALLGLARVSTRRERFRPIVLNETVDEVLEDLELSLATTGAQVHVEPLGTIEADPLQVQQLFINLIGNAIKFQRADVRPVIRIHAERDDVWAGALPACRITIEDNGVGFNEKYLDRIFAPFQRLHGRSQFPGTGMGLAICRRIVERHGGTISARSTPGEGSAFILTLPLNQPEEDAEKGARA